MNLFVLLFLVVEVAKKMLFWVLIFRSHYWFDPDELQQPLTLASDFSSLPL